MRNNKKSERLGTEPIVPLLFRLSLPGIAAMAIQALYNVVDSIYIGHVSTDALSALTLSFPIQMILIGIAVGTGVGTNSLISRLLGRNKPEEASNVAEHVLLIAVIYGIIGVFAGIFLAKDLIGLFNDDPVLINMGSEYIRIILTGSFFLFVPMISNNILRGQGNTIIPMYTMLIGAILNIILDPFFIYGIWIFPEWGVAGAAFATVLSRVISGIFIVYILFSDVNELKINLAGFKFNFTIITRLYKVGFPAMLMQLLGSFTLAGMNKILASYSNTAIAAAGIYFRLQSFIFMPIFGLNQGYMPIMGYNYGNNNPERIKLALKSAMCIAFIFTLTGLILFQSFPGFFIKMFNPEDAELIRIGTHALKIISFSFPFAGIGILSATTFQAFGKGFPGLVIAFLRMLVILLPLMYILGMHYGLNYLWYSFPITEITGTTVASLWLLSVLKKIFKKMYMQKEINT